MAAVAAAVTVAGVECMTRNRPMEVGPPGLVPRLVGASRVKSPCPGWDGPRRVAEATAGSRGAEQRLAVVHLSDSDILPHFGVRW